MDSRLIMVVESGRSSVGIVYVLRRSIIMKRCAVDIVNHKCSV